MSAKSGEKKFRVYVAQVNQTVIDVTAKDEAEAAEKGYRAWRREYSHSRVIAVEPEESR